MNETSLDIDEYLRTTKAWRDELARLRGIVLECDLTEEFKWRQPCYTHRRANIVILGGFKRFCSISFFKGALLKDPRGVLVKPGENTQAARQIRFTCVPEILDLETVLRDYIRDAVEVERAGLKISPAADAAPAIPDELQAKFDEFPVLETAFAALTPGRQRAYLLHFTGAKQSKTRSARIERYVTQILDGKGINDCTCGLSRKMPGCDGSHKSLR